MKTLFVNPFFLLHSALERRFKTFYFPLGLLYMAAAAREAGHDVAVFDGTFAHGEGAFRAALDAFAPEAVCIGSWITVQPTALRLAQIAAEQEVKVIVGGPGPTASPAAYLDHPAVGVVVMGEGERTLVELLAALNSARPLADVEGLALSDGAGGVIESGKRETIHNLDSLPMPARDLIAVEQYLDMWETEHGYRSLTISMTRGCPDDDCPFCASSVMGMKLRQRSIDNIVKEMRALQDTYTIGRFRLVDDLNRLERDRLFSLGKAMIAAGVTIPYEGLNTVIHEDLPMLAPTRDVCHERNAWIPTQGQHGHAPPTENVELVRRRWEQALLLEGERLEEP